MWQKLSLIIERQNLSVRLKFRDGTESAWSNWLTFPSEGYGEIKTTGPFLIRDVSQIEVNSVEIKSVGRLRPIREIDHSEQLRNDLAEADIRFGEKNGIFFINC